MKFCTKVVIRGSLCLFCLQALFFLLLDNHHWLEGEDIGEDKVGSGGI